MSIANRQHFKTTILIVLLVILISFGLMKFGSNDTVSELANQIDHKEVSETITGEADIPHHDLKTEPILRPSSEVQAFNDFVTENISQIGTGLKPTLLYEVFESLNTGAIDIESAANQLMEIMKDPVVHQLSMRDLFSFCEALEKRVMGTINESVESSVEGEDFLLALQKSGYCKNIGTETDPFFVILGLARKGDKVARLYLIDDLYFAIQRGLIKPNLFPLEYHDLRAEIIDYLVSLSYTGIVQASLNLQRLYSTSNFLVPEDKVMAYYYAVLVDKQSDGQMLYDQLNETQKTRADRMTKRLK